LREDEIGSRLEQETQVLSAIDCNIGFGSHLDPSRMVPFRHGSGGRSTVLRAVTAKILNIKGLVLAVGYLSS
jgi:hypothetical protein